MCVILHRLAFLLSSLWMVTATEAHYEVSSITYNTGIYYEKLPSIRIQKKSFHLDWYAFLKEHGSTRSYDEQLISALLTLMLNIARLLSTKNSLKSDVHNDIRRLAAHMDAREMEISSPIKDICAKRMAPLGIIGSISKSLFGLITTDDANVINKNID